MRKEEINRRLKSEECIGSFAAGIVLLSDQVLDQRCAIN